MSPFQCTHNNSPIVCQLMLRLSTTRKQSSATTPWCRLLHGINLSQDSQWGMMYCNWLVSQLQCVLFKLQCILDPMWPVGISSILSEVTDSPLHSPNGRQHACRWCCATRPSNSLRTTQWSLPQTRAHTDSGRPTCLHGFQAPYTHPVLRITRPVYGWMRSSRYSRNTHLRKCAVSWWSQLRGRRHPDNRRYRQSPGWSIYCMWTAWLCYLVLHRAVWRI